MNSVIVAFQAVPKQPPIPQRARPARLRSLPQFSAIVAWVVSAVLQHQGQDVSHVSLDSVAPALVDQVSEETVRALAALDPIAEGVARRRARQSAADLLANVLTNADPSDLKDTAYRDALSNELTDLVLARYRTQLVYGSATAPEVQN